MSGQPLQAYHLLLGITGASGAIYAQTLLEKARSLPHLRLSIVLSKNAQQVWDVEVPTAMPHSPQWRYWEHNDFTAPFASGSHAADAMLILPCSMGSIGRMAHGVSDDLITRAADVQLKERRPLILVPRESPYNLIHLRNLTQLTEAGALIVPASPSFYHQPQTIAALIEPFIDRLLYLCGAVPDYTGFRWGHS